MSPRRSRLEIRLSILSAVRDGVDKPTRIMYAANLSWKPTQRVLGQLLEQRLISEESGDGSGRSRRRYVITDKGVAVLRYFDDARKLLPIEDVYSHA